MPTSETKMAPDLFGATVFLSGTGEGGGGNSELPLWICLVIKLLKSPKSGFSKTGQSISKFHFKTG